MLNRKDNQVKIVCIAWGSLLWSPGPLKLASDWHPDGPPMPLEFVRDSDDSDELAIVLHPPAPLMPTFWAELDTDDLAEAREMLRQREKIRPDLPHWVGSLPHAGVLSITPGADESRIAGWMKTHGVDAAVWTACPAKFAHVNERAPSAHEAVAFLAGLQGQQRINAEQYVRKIPKEINTLYRGLFEEKLGWTPEG